MTEHLGRDRWFAGFVDGEGCFAIRRSAGRYGASFHPELAIALRADDMAIIEAIRGTFGGGVSIHRPLEAAPIAKVQISSKRDLAGLVAYFDKFPLRAKKARDYAVWRQAVCLYCANGGGRKRGAGAQLETLRDVLMALRAYEGEGGADMAVPAQSQLRLVEGAS